jgi:hypothetical protein
MDQQFPNFIPVTFSEHHFIKPNQEKDTEFDILIEAPFSNEKYALALFGKIFYLGLSEIAPFLDHHCSLVKNPTKWLNSLEKLIKENIDLFDTRKLQHRHIKLISQIDIKRIHSNLSSSRHKKLNGFSDEKEYCFLNVQQHIQQYEFMEEKIAYLHGQILDYRQNPPDFVSTKEQHFDAQCELEIERLEKQDQLLQKASTRKNSIKKGKMMPVEGELKILCDAFFKMMHMTTKNGKQFLSWTITEATDFICSNFCASDGTPFNPVTVRTYLSASKPDSRPKRDSEFTL